MIALSRLAILILAGFTMGVVSATGVVVPLDVDVYDKPADESTKRSQFLKGGSQVLLLQKRADSWCNVAPGKDPVPGGTGWIWCGKGNDGQNYAVKPIVAETPAEPANPPTSGDAAQPTKRDCTIIGPNKKAGGGSSDPKETFRCDDIGDGKKECCFYRAP